MFRRDKKVDLKLGVKSLCSGHKISSLKVVFDFLSANSINLEHRQAKRKISHRNGQFLKTVELYCKMVHVTNTVVVKLL